MSPENVKRKRSAMDFNAIEAEPFIKALKDGGTRTDDAGRARGQLMSNSCLSPSRVIRFQQCLLGIGDLVIRFGVWM